MRTALFLLLCGSVVAADVLVLKSGENVVGRVNKKDLHYEVTTDVGLRTFLIEEVDRVVTDPAEFLGDADALYEQAKADYQKAGTLDSQPTEKNRVLKESVEKLHRARQKVASTRELFPEDKYSSLDKKLVNIMMLMRMARSSFTSERIEPRRPALPPGTPAPKPPAPAAAPALLDQAFATLIDPAKRGDAAARKAALETLRSQRPTSGGAHDIATAGMLFLEKSDAEWGLAGPALEEVQTYFAKPWLKNPTGITSPVHLEAAAYLAGRIAAVKTGDAKGAVGALSLFALGHLGQAPKGADRDTHAKAAGFEAEHGRVGTVEGLAVADILGWINEGSYDLAAASYVLEHRKRADTPAVQFAWSWALLNQAIERCKGFDRPVKAFSSISGPNSAAKAHFIAMGKSIKEITPCKGCKGEGWLRCTNCHGKRAITFICPRCEGKRMVKTKAGGYVFCNACKFTGIRARFVCKKCSSGYFDCRLCKLPKCGDCKSTGRKVCADCKGDRVSQEKCSACQGSGLSMSTTGSSSYEDYLCGTCGGSGSSKVKECGSCPNGFVDCGSCEPMRRPPGVAEICEVAVCTLCEGRGSLFRGAEWSCPHCLGLGLKLVPKADPKKVLSE